jgi:hypothetical protein
MNRTTAILITTLTGLCCGLPGLGAILFGAVAALAPATSEQVAANPDFSEQVLMGSLFFIIPGILALLIPVVAGIVSFKLIKTQDEPASAGFEEFIPPAS